MRCTERPENSFAIPRSYGRLRPADIEAGRDDDGGAHPSQEIGEVAEEKIADDHRAQELHVLEGRDDISRRIGERVGESVLMRIPSSWFT